MPEGAAIGVLLCALAIAVAVRTLIGAVFLRAAVALHNKITGEASSPSSVPEPAFGKAMRIIFDISLAQIIAGYVIGVTAGTWGQRAEVVAGVIFFAVSLLVMVEMLSTRLPTTLGCACHVTVCYLVVELLVVGVLVGMAAFVFAVAMRGA
jgi:hypothetical protein